MERSLLDTDTFSEVLKGRNDSIRTRSDAYLSVFGRFMLSVTSIAELIDGFRRWQRDAEIARLLTKVELEGHETIAIDLEAAKLPVISSAIYIGLGDRLEDLIRLSQQSRCGRPSRW